MSLVRGSGNGGGGISVPSDQIFTDNAARDAYFVANPAKLVEGAQCIVKTNPPEGLYQIYNGSAWENHTAAVVGPAGSDGSTTFTTLTDAPNDYTGKAGQVVKVKSTEDGLEFEPDSGVGSDSVIYGGIVTTSVNPMLPGWGSPTETTSIIMGTVTGEFVDAPSAIPAGEYRGTIVKHISTNFVDLMYTTLSGRMYKKLIFVDGGTQTSGWEELGVSAKEAIWTLKGNNSATATTTAGPSKFTADMSKFNAVETDFLGDLNIGAGSDFEFTVGQSGAFEVQIHGAIEDPNNSTQKIAITIYDSATNDHMTGSMQILSPASTWGSTNEYTFNCNGFARLDPNNTVSLQVMVDADASLILKECIVILKPIEY